ncbi:MAG: hypothetical protein VXV96_13310 [Bdellovibrionota bacterium]|nr:hypothetical protein [Bdellovibrionota bacterium]
MELWKRPIFLVFVVFSFINFEVESRTFIHLEGSYGYFSQKPAKEFNLYPAGISYGAIIENKFRYFMLGLFYQKSSYSGEIISDNETIVMTQEMTAYGLSARLDIGRRYFISSGIGMADLAQSIPSTIDSERSTAISSFYQLSEEDSSFFVEFGVGYKFYKHRVYSGYVRLNRRIYSSFDASEMNLILGLGMRF